MSFSLYLLLLSPPSEMMSKARLLFRAVRISLRPRYIASRSAVRPFPEAESNRLCRSSALLVKALMSSARSLCLSSLVLIAVLFNRTSSGGHSVGDISNEGRRGHYQRGATRRRTRRRRRRASKHKSAYRTFGSQYTLEPRGGGRSLAFILRLFMPMLRNHR